MIYKNYFANIYITFGKGNKVKNKQDYLKLKKLLHSKRNHQQNEREPTVWENIFSSDTSDKGFSSKIQKDLHNSTARRQSNLKLGKGPE